MSIVDSNAAFAAVDDDDDRYADASMWCFVVPPSYEECTMAGQVDIREEENNEYIRGELSWRPKYPMYWQLSEPQAATASDPAQVHIDNM